MPQSSNPPSSDDFEIAIVCLPGEGGEEIQALLDVEYDDDAYTKVTDDINDYITGRIKCTNVVLVTHELKYSPFASGNDDPVLPTFPKIKVILDVGLCGAAPRTKDDKEILVGDAIISHKLWWYEDGKQWPDKISKEDTLQRGLTEMDERAMKLKSFLHALSTYHRHAILEENTGKWMRELVDNPVFDMKDLDRSEDILYPRSYTHKHSSDTCSSCANGPPCLLSYDEFCDQVDCDSHRAVPRKRHACGDIGTVLHFGTLVENPDARHFPVTRDELGVDTTGAVGFVAENPSLGVPLPTIFIKGVADYADGHGLQFWHEYAACVVASCLKAFIEGWSPDFGDSFPTASLAGPLSPWDGTGNVQPKVSPVEIRYSIDSSRTPSYNGNESNRALNSELGDFVKCLVADGTMNSLFTNAFRESKNSQEIVDNFAILLRNYALKLRDQAQNKIEIGMADNVFWEAANVSEHIRLKWTVTSTAIADDADDSPKYFSIPKIKTFMLENSPFLELQHEFEMFVHFARQPEEIPNAFPADNYDPLGEINRKNSSYTQLSDLGYDHDRMLRFISELKALSPWVLVETADSLPDSGPPKQGFHTYGCAHEPLLEGGLKAQVYPSISRTLLPVEVRHKVERTCGLAGVLPIRGNEHEWFQEVKFSTKQLNSVEIQLGGSSAPSWRRDSLGTRLTDIMDRCIRVLSWAQEKDLCCDSYTTLRIDGDQIKLVEVPFLDVYLFYTTIVGFDGSAFAQNAVRIKARKLLGLFYGEELAGLIMMKNWEHDAIDFCATIAAQSCSLSILLYFHAHCGPLKLSILTQEIKNIFLKCPGLNVKPRIRTVWLSCVGDMLKKPVMAFSAIAEAVPKESIAFDLVGTLRNVIYTWGPARVLADIQCKSPKILLVWIQDGTVTASRQTPNKLHWGDKRTALATHTAWFDLDNTMVIAGNTTNAECPTLPLLLRNSHTTSTEWEGHLDFTLNSTQVSPRQLGFQQDAQFSVYLARAPAIPVPGTNLKTAIVRDFEVQSIRGSNMEAPWGLRVSFCSGVCERVSLRTVLADNVELFGRHCPLALNYVTDWQELLTVYDLQRNLRTGTQEDWRTWYAGLGTHHKSIMNDAMCYTISRLRPTGYVAEEFVIAKPSFDDISLCIRIPCTEKYLWMKALADDEFCATFAYLTPTCLERRNHVCDMVNGDGHRCRDEERLTWNSSTVGLNSSLSFQLSSKALGMVSDDWTLKSGKYYAIGRPQLGLCVLATCGNCIGPRCSENCLVDCAEKHLVVKEWRLPGKLKQILAEHCRLIEDSSHQLRSTKALVMSPLRLQKGLDRLHNRITKAREMANAGDHSGFDVQHDRIIACSWPHFDGVHAPLKQALESSLRTGN